MTVRWWATGVAVCAAIAPPALAEDDELVFAPSSPWTVEYDADSCALRRTFTSGEDRVYLEIRRFAPGWGLQTTIASSRAGSRFHPNVKYRFTDDEDWRQPGLGLSVTLESRLGRTALSWMGVGSPSVRLRLTPGLPTPIQLPLHPQPERPIALPAHHPNRQPASRMCYPCPDLNVLPMS